MKFKCKYSECLFDEVHFHGGCSCACGGTVGNQRDGYFYSLGIPCHCQCHSGGMPQ